MSVEQEFSVSEDAKALVKEIIVNSNWEPVSDIKYYPGTEAGDGYASKHVGVEIVRPAGTINLFMKYSLDFKVPVEMSVDKFYGNEIYFYDVVLPAFQKFLSEKNIQDGFRHAPKCYGTSAKNVIALENIKDKGYTLFDRKTIMNEKHITLVLKTFAKFHATSFAFKDQDRKSYDKLVANWDGDLAAATPKDSPIKKMWVSQIQDALNSLDPIKDKRIIDRCDAEALNDFVINTQQYENEYSVFTQGDCWCNNMMFKYGDENTDNPADVMLVDWQLFRPLSPVFDISYFFYTIASEEALAKVDTYLNIYYAELTSQIKRMGSDPKKLYPKVIFLKEWKQFCKYGFGMAFMLFKFMLVDKADAPKMEDLDFENADKINFFSKFRNEEEYTRRLRTLAHFMVDRDYV